MSGVTLVRTEHFALHRIALDAVLDSETSLPLFDVSDVWLGVQVPKRWAKRAVTRNAIKRQIYTVSLDFESALQPAAYVVRLRAVFDRKQFISATSQALKVAVRKELLHLFAKATATVARPGW